MNAYMSCRKCRFLWPVFFLGKGSRISCLYKNTVNGLQRPSTKFLNCTSAVHTYVRNVNRMCVIRHRVALPKVYVSTSALEVNTKVAKDVILYRYDNPKFFRIVNIFALCQFGFWTYLSHFAFTSMRDAPVPKDRDDLPWWRKINLGENKYRNGLTVLSFLIGYGILAAAWLFTLKSVRYLILRKGGDKLTFVTYTPFGKNRMMTVDVNKVSSQESRQNARVQLPIKVKNFHLFFMLDMKGEFKNPKLFDHTAGLKRAWKD